MRLPGMGPGPVLSAREVTEWLREASVPGDPDLTVSSAPRLQPDVVPPEVPFHPHTRDLKAMSPDVVSAWVTVGAMLAERGLTRADLEEAALYVGKPVGYAGLQRELEELTATCLVDDGGTESVAARNARLLAGTHPLIALKVLSNAMQSYLAQGFGSCGDSTTFGNTSIAGFHAVAEGFSALQTGRARLAIVGGTNASDTLSAAPYLGFPGTRLGYRESGCSAFLLLCTETEGRARGWTPVAEVVECRTSPTPPTWRTPAADAPAFFSAFGPLLGDAVGAHAVFHGGGLGEPQFRREQAALGDGDRWSWFPRFGNLGPASVPAHLIAAATLVSQGSLDVADCLDRDPYGRESWIRLRAVGRTSP